MSEKEKEAIVEEQQQDISELLQIRRDKLAALQAEGNNPFFVNTCDKDISAQEIHDRFEELEGKDVCIAGRIMSWRDMGKASFMDIHDRSGRMQVYLKIDEVGEDVYKGLSNWDLGDIAEVKGYMDNGISPMLKHAAEKFLYMQNRFVCFPNLCFHCLKSSMDLRIQT